MLQIRPTRCGYRVFRGIALVLGLACGWAAVSAAANVPLFERDVLPILTRNCLGCHGGLRQRGGLEMRTVAAGREGGDSGPAWQAGDLEASQVWQRLVGDEMPPDDRKLSAAEKEIVRRWIVAGLPTVMDLDKTADPLLAPGTAHRVEDVAAAIDRHVQAGLDEAGLKPMPTIGDAEFLRRIYLDLAGRVPTADQAAAFLDDPAPDKRARLIESLLEMKDFGRHFGRTWLAWMLPPTLPVHQMSGKDMAEIARQFGHWIGDRVAKGDRWNTIVTDILTGQGRTAEAAFFQMYGSPHGLPLPGGTAIAVGRMFMGVSLRCAECHDDPYRDWSQREFWALSAFFQGLSGSDDFGLVKEFPVALDPAAMSEDAKGLEKRLAGFGFQQSPGPDRIVIPNTALNDAGSVVQARFPKGEEFRTTKSESLRPHFAAWLTTKDNPYFAKAFANRLWFGFFARGIVQPVDDFRDLNPPSHPGLIAMLSSEFGDSGFDIKHLIRCICNSATYQRSSRIPTGMQEPAVAALTAAYGRAPLRLMPPEVFYDSLSQVYGGARPQQELDLRVLDAGGASTKGQAAPTMDPRTEFMRRFCVDRSNVTDYVHGVPQRLALLNHPRLLAGSPALDAFRKPAANRPEKAADEILEWLFLATLSRRPTDVERSEARDFLRRSPDDYLRILWTLVNGSEYFLIR
jgi:hypothetical protein